MEVAHSRNGETTLVTRPQWHFGKRSMIPDERPEFALVFRDELEPGSNLWAMSLTRHEREVGAGTCQLPVEATAAVERRAARTINIVPMRSANGENWISVAIADVPGLWGIVDTGATLVSMPENIAALLVAGGDAHWTGQRTTMTTADGNRSPSRIFVIHRMTIGTQTLTDVIASTAPRGAPFLIGMSALGRLGPMRIDVASGTVVFG
jgi:clan AA aspartic protease (TIGR02281 family)